MPRRSKLTVDDVVERVADQIAAEVDDDLVMVNVETGYYYAVSDVAREIWDAIERPRRISDLIDELTASHEVERAVCEDETLSFLQNLLAERLVRVSDGPSS